ncbi:MAG: hypothetical protein HY652_08065 [Acidobacteria bacterium]|nr:hypothetical protein [Acidobacteriota bacterium]
MDIAADRQGRLYVLCSPNVDGNRRETVIDVFDPSGSFLYQLGGALAYSLALSQDDRELILLSGLNKNREGKPFIKKTRIPR